MRQDGLQPDLSPIPAGVAISRNSIVDLTSKLDTSGRLTWDVPNGSWVILRIGHTPTGKDNHPAPPEGDGLEVDKLSREALDVHWNGMMAKVIAECGPLAGKVLNNSLIDSYEVGSQNWTPRFREEFRKRRGYDPTPYLPVLTGHVVESADASDRFLWDFRRTIADLLADNHYGVFAELAHRRGVGIYSEAAGVGLPMLQDALQNKGRVEIPMGEFWVRYPAGAIDAQYIADVREAASAAHIYGKKLVGAESFTTGGLPGWAQPPSYLKWLGDYNLALGLNRIIFHTSVHQPFKDRKPGMTLGPFGQHFNRNMTWAEIAGPFISYLSRSMYLLQKGLFVGDLC
ncbi:MAG: glycoside hydrolase, partial [Fimbriimonas ginsengisoli]|nr:glycoside hydrolase [Fimbriimonas ginsengisoli]